MMSFGKWTDTIRIPRRRRRARGPRPDQFAVIVGAGFAGLGMAIKLRQAGIHRFVVIEKEHEVGGTWFVNTYPGCACDVQSHVYSYSFEGNPNWSRAFSSQPEILQYLQRCAKKYNIYENTRFGTVVVGARFDEAEQLWRVRLAQAADVDAFVRAKGLPPGSPPPVEDPDFPPVTELTSRVLVSAMGGLSTPAYPNIPGLDSFEGQTFHSQRWDHSYDLKGKRVAVIGTGASAIQFVPEIQPEVAQLDLYQRTPPWVLPKPDHAISARRRWLFRNVPGARPLHRLRLFSLLESRALAFVLNPKLARRVQKFALSYMERKVPDPELRAKLTPNYELGCKRVLLSRNWYPALTQDNVEVVTEGIREVRAHSVVDKSGRERSIDAIIFGTGFRVTDPVPRGLFFGRGGRDILDCWTRGPEAYKGTTVAGFPNFFMLIGPNTGLGHNSIVYMIEAQLRYVMGAVDMLRRKDVAEVEVRQDVQDRFNEKIQAKSQKTVWVSGGCKSYYLDDNGKNVAVWPDFTVRFAAITRRFDSENYRLRKPAAKVSAADLGMKSPAVVEAANGKRPEPAKTVAPAS